MQKTLTAADFLRGVLQELDSNVGAIWVGHEGQLVPELAVGIEESGLFEGSDGKSLLQRVLTDTLNQARAQTFDTEGLIEPRAFGHATLFLAPLLVPGARSGVILVAERPNLPQQQRLALMRHIELRCQELSREVATISAVPQPFPAQLPQLEYPPEFLTSSSPSNSSAPPAVVISGAPAPVVSTSSATSAINSKAVLDYLLSLQRSLDLNEIANVIVNDGRILFEVDRVGLAIRRGRKSVIKAISGQESVHPRGNLIRALRRLTQKVLTSGEPFRFDGGLNSVPKQLEEPLADFIQESGTRFLLIVPLQEPERLVKVEEPMGGGKPRRVVRKFIGALIVEQMSSSEPSPQLKSTIDAVTDHIAAATYNSCSHSSIFLLPLWRSLGHFFEWLRGRRLAIAILILMLISAAAAAMVLVPWEYRVEARGLLMPVIQCDVFAPEDGQVDELLVKGDQLVQKGDPLILLINHELEAELVKAQNIIHEKSKLWSSLKTQKEEAERQGKTDEKNRAHGKQVETQVEIDGAIKQSKMLKERIERLVIRAPITGKVTTFQIQQLLLNRPVKKGEVLLQVMDESGDWHLELEIAEHRVGRLLKARKKLSPALPIEYRLLTSPESNYYATLDTMATRTVTAEEKGSVLEARAILDKDQLPKAKATIGAEVRARIGCGESFLGDVLFGDVIEFVQKYLWW